MDWIDSAALGLLSGFALLMAVGPQSLFVLRHGLSGRHVAAVCITVIGCDVLLLSLGIVFHAALSDRIAGAETVMTLGGALFLAACGSMSLVRASLPKVAMAGMPEDAVPEPCAPLSGDGQAAVLGALAVTLLNPLVYLDTIVVMGGLATASAAPYAFLAGALTASSAAFLGMGYGARLLRPVLDGPGGAHRLDLISGGLMLVLAAALWQGL